MKVCQTTYFLAGDAEALSFLFGAFLIGVLAGPEALLGTGLPAGLTDCLSDCCLSDC